MRGRSIIIFQMLALLAGTSPSWARSQAKFKAEDYLAVQWASIQYSKSVVVQNPKVTSNSNRNQTSERLTLSCQVEIRDPNRILGTTSVGTITALTDGDGRNVAVSPPASRFHLGYTGLRYRERFVMPERRNKWQNLIRSLVRTKPSASTGPQRVTELQPNSLQLDLDMSLLDQAGGEIRRIKGAFHALATESIEYVDVPFEPNDNWVRLTPDVEIHIQEAWANSSSYRFRIEASPQSGRSPFDLSVGKPLPSRMVIERQLLNADGKPVHGRHGFGHLPASVGGSGSGGGGNGPVKTIRYVIAVNPSHNEIPFELEHIPLPKP